MPRRRLEATSERACLAGEAADETAAAAARSVGVRWRFEGTRPAGEVERAGEVDADLAEPPTGEVAREAERDRPPGELPAGERERDLVPTVIRACDVDDNVDDVQKHSQEPTSPASKLGS